MTIPDQWPEINVEILSPASILRVQASRLKEKSRGLLVGDVTVTESGEEKQVSLQLDVIASALGGYRHRILRAIHHPKLVYPVTIDAECYREFVEASTEAEFVTKIGEVLQSSQVKSVIDSLIARSNEESSPTRRAS